MSIKLVLLFLLVPSFSYAEGTPLAWDSHRDIAKWMANTSVGANLAMYLWKSDDSWKCKSIKLGLANLANEGVKRLVHRARPDGTDNKSYFSQHTMNSTLSAGWNFQIGIPLAVITGYSQQADKRHYFTDALSGAVFGFGMSKIC